MDNNTFGNMAVEYCRTWQEVSDTYELCAQSVGMTYSSLFTLTVIYDSPEGCTQKTIAGETFLPKQTVNAVIRGFLKQGFVVLKEAEADRRNKIVRLTEEGRAFAEKIIPRIKSAESEAMEKLDAQQRKALIENSKLYAACFSESMRGRFGSGTCGE